MMASFRQRYDVKRGRKNVNPLLIESLARQRAMSQRLTKGALAVVRVSPRRRPLLNRLGEEMIALGSRLAFSGVDASFVGMRQSW